MFVTIWQFQVKPGHEDDFVRVYGENGEWMKLFQKAPGYIGTEFHRDLQAKGRYLTIDRWDSRDAYENFQVNWKDEYEVIDRRCENWTVGEVLIGQFEPHGGSGYAHSSN